MPPPPPPPPRYERRKEEKWRWWWANGYGKKNVKKKYVFFCPITVFFLWYLSVRIGWNKKKKRLKKINEKKKEGSKFHGF